MGTISEKLTYLNTTKQNIKQAINNLGGDIDNNTTFRQYANVLNNIYSNLPKVSDTGTNVSLSPTLKGRLGSVLNGNTYQETTTGKNLLNLGNVSGKNSNVTYSIENGKLKLNGTCSADRITINLPTQNALNGTYTFSTNYSTYNIALKNSSYNNLFITTTSVTATINDTITQIVIYSSNGTQYNNKLIELQVESGSTATSYEPYTGGIASPNPDYPQEIQSATGTQKVVVSGKNLFDLSTISENTYLNTLGETGTSSASNVSDYIEILGGEDYYLSFDYQSLISTGDRAYCYYDSNKTYISGNAYVITNKKATFSVPNNAKYIRFAYDKNCTDIKFIETPQEVDIELGNIELNKIGDYEDYIDGTPDNWVLYKNIGKVVLDGSETYSSMGWGSNKYAYRTNINNIKQISDADEDSNIISNYYESYSFNGLYNSSEKYGLCNRLNQSEIIIRNDDYSTNTQLQNWLSTHNTELLYVLATTEQTPITEEPLVSQLNELYYLQSYNDTTNIDVTGKLPIRITASAIKGA